MRLKQYMYLYIILCSDDSFYTGVTNDLMNRYIDHEKGDNKRAYTYSRRPFKFLYWEIYESPEDAIHREKQIKKWNRAKKNALIYGNFGKLKKLAKRRK